MDKIRQFAENQRRDYDPNSVTEDSAKAKIAPDYDQARREANSSAHFMLAYYFLRNGLFYEPNRSNIADLKLFDFGCGIGRVMDAFRELGCEHVDGCDISREMLKHAQANPFLSRSRFFLSEGADTGNSPSGHYDMAYSLLCLHHIPMRQTRIKIFESLARNLRDGGMIFAGFKVFPGATAAKIPKNHAHWTENMVAFQTNSASDVWITPDALGLVYEDFRLFFNDIAILEMDTGAELYNYNSDGTYQYGFNEIYVLGTKGMSLKALMDTRIKT